MLHARLLGWRVAEAKRPLNQRAQRRTNMLSYSLSFLVLAIVAGFLGFGIIAGTAAWIAKVLFGVFIVLFFVSLLTGRRTPAV
jgi:uncharacterized membrane protein YtjA (UPF0391 family)